MLVANPAITKQAAGVAKLKLKAGVKMPRVKAKPLAIASPLLVTVTVITLIT